MDIREIRWGMKVRDRHTKFEFVVVSFGAGIDGRDAWVYCDFEGNEGDVWEFVPEDLEDAEDRR
jgi:hypothetical protein